ncbi:GIP, partial [Symbiodinium pilosum]
MESFLDQPLTTDAEIALTYSNEVVNRPTGIRTLREWGEYEVDSGKHKDQKFHHIYETDPGYGKYIRNRQLTNRSILSYRSYYIAREQAKCQGNPMSPGSVPLRSSTTSEATVFSQTEMTAGRMKSPSQQDQRPIPPGKPVTPRVTGGSSSSKRESSWAVLEETRKPMTTELTPSREQEIRTQMALLQRELDQVGLDLASWKNAKGKEFSFVHFIDEGTMFHLGAECLQGTESVMEHFENLWVNWAGYPQEVYVDPGGEFVSESWVTRTQEAGIKVHMSASDSHWQLGRAEIHGSTVKQMLSRMDLEESIESSVAFQRAMRQVFHAKNTSSRVDGYTPQQAVLGIASKLPGSILSDGDASTRALADSNTPEGQRFLHQLQVPESARRAFIQELERNVQIPVPEGESALSMDEGDQCELKGGAYGRI